MDRKTDWVQLKEATQLNEIIMESECRPVIIYKHSTRCGLSYSAKDKLEHGWEMLKTKAKFYYLDIIQYRSVSNRVSEKFQVSHQSPQVLIIKNGKSVYDVSHHLIEIGEIIRYL